MWPWLPERVVVVHIPCVLTRAATRPTKTLPVQSYSAIKKTERGALATIS